MATTKSEVRKDRKADVASDGTAELRKDVLALLKKVADLEARVASCEQCCKAAPKQEAGDFVTRSELGELKKKIARAARIRI